MEGSSNGEQPLVLLRGVVGAMEGVPCTLCPRQVGRPCELTRGLWLGWLGGYICLPHFSKSLSNLGFTKEKPAKALWSMESMRFLSL